MLEVEGYKMFKGTMRITPKNATIDSFTKRATWLYKPEYRCWYSNDGRSFSEEICTVEEDFYKE